jgi:hypothetical protein
MIIILIIGFSIGFILGYLFKILYFKLKFKLPIYEPYYEAPKQIYIPVPYRNTTDDLEFELKQVKTLLSTNLFGLALENGRIPDYIYKQYSGEYKKLKLKELALIEKINKINKDNFIYKFKEECSENK